VGSKSAGSGAAKSLANADENSDKSALDAIDREYLGRFTLGNAALEREVLQLFAGQAHQYLQQLRHATSVEDWANAAHTIKGSALAIGARRLASIAEMAERLDIASAMAESQAREQAIEAVAEALDEVCRSIAQIAPPA
jgi:HPt (histidine-containing phosphotransfer) domain-containing protein